VQFRESLGWPHGDPQHKFLFEETPLGRGARLLLPHGELWSGQEGQGRSQLVKLTEAAADHIPSGLTGVEDGRSKA
jgi:hypothetical protein